jgi:hypothetical protein
MNQREMTHEELKNCHDEIIEENESLKLINQILVKTIINLKGDRKYLLGQLSKIENENKKPIAHEEDGIR